MSLNCWNKRNPILAHRVRRPIVPLCVAVEPKETGNFYIFIFRFYMVLVIYTGKFMVDDDLIFFFHPFLKLGKRRVAEQFQVYDIGKACLNKIQLVALCVCMWFYHLDVVGVLLMLTQANRITKTALAQQQSYIFLEFSFSYYSILSSDRLVYILSPLSTPRNGQSASWIRINVDFLLKWSV